MIGGGQTSLLYRELVIEQKLAVSAWAYYHGTALDQSRFIANATPAPGVSLDTLDKAFDKVLAKFMADGIDEGALERAKTRLVADAIYARDSQSDLARWYGSSLALGQTISDVEEWPSKSTPSTPRPSSTPRAAGSSPSPQSPAISCRWKPRPPEAGPAIALLLETPDADIRCRLVA